MTHARLADAQTLAAPFPPLLAAAERLAATVSFGDHGRRRPGFGDAFWQYRPAQPGDSLRRIDWRRSARADDAFVREAEDQTAQSVLFWCDPSASMSFDSTGEPKSHRAQLLTLAMAYLLLRKGERVGVTGGGLKTRTGLGQLDRLHAFLTSDTTPPDYGAPDLSGLVARSQAVFLSDFLGPMEPVQAAMEQATNRGVAGSIIMVLDPQERKFPFKGRSIFESMAGSVRYETKQAADLQADYQSVLQDRIDLVRSFARTAGWGFHLHTTDQSAQSALLWLYQSVQGYRA